MSECSEHTYFAWLRQVTFAQIWDEQADSGREKDHM
jgi:hypothetical protein